MKRVAEREAAKTAGERFYETGKPCRNGHLSKRYTGTGVCAVCAITNTLRCQAKGREHPNRTAARTAGERHYSTGIACKHGHAKRFVANGVCVECGVQWNKNFKAARPGMEAKWARERRANDPTSHRKSSRKWAKNNRASVNASSKRCRDRNPELWRKRGVAYVQTRKTRLRGNGGSFTAEDIDVMHKRQKGRCAACFKARKLQVDHIVAVVNGGSSDPANLQLLCGPCNKSKGRKDAMEWAREHGRLL